MRNGSVIVVAMLLLSGSAWGADANSVSTSGMTYVDIRTGFSVELAAGWEVTGWGVPAGVTGRGKQEGWPGLGGWEPLKLPASKELVRFVLGDGERAQYAEVNLLAIKRELSLGEMVAARQRYWQKNTTRAIVSADVAGLGKGKSYAQPTAFLTVLWRSDDQGAWQWLIREALIQSEAGRYFLLRLITPTGQEKTDDEPTLEIEQIAERFVCLGETQVRRRWSQGSQRGQALLRRVGSAGFEGNPSEQSCYRVLRGGNEIGFFISSASAAPSADPNVETALTMICSGYVADAEGALALARMLGWGKSARGEAGQLGGWKGPVALSGRIVLRGGRGGETFEFTVGACGSSRGYREEGAWQRRVLRVKRWDDLTQPDKVIVREFEVKQELYMPWSVWRRLGNVLDGKASDEYVFMHYGNRTLGHSAVRVTAQTPLPRRGANDKNVVKVARLSRYVVAQMSADGPIVESWFSDEDGGGLIQQRSNGITLRRCAKEGLMKRWAEQIKDVKGGIE